MRVLSRGRKEDVFFFTLIDFLVQILCFALFVYVAAQVIADERARENQAEIDKLLSTAGVSSIAELTDELTKLVPLKEAVPKVKLVDAYGGARSVGGALEAASAAAAAASRAPSWTGTGPPPCQWTTVAGHLVPVRIGHATVEDESITIDDVSPQLLRELAQAGLSIEQVRRTSPDAFGAVFKPLLSHHADCHVFLNLTNKTDKLHVMNAFRFVFN